MTLTRGSIYRRTVLNTTMLYPKAMNFDVHAPTRMTQSQLSKIARVNFSKPYGYCLHTLYAATNNLTGIACADLKIRQPVVNLQEAIAGRVWFSTADRVMTKEMIDQFKVIYNQKSPWE